MKNSDTVILGIESSCDETAAAIVVLGEKWEAKVKSNIIATQFDLHAEYGGVVPEIASRAHLERILPVVENALKDAGITNPRNEINAIAVSHRPGLIGSLLVGVGAAKALAWAWAKPLIGVDHVLAHLHAVTLDDQPIKYPALGLVVSGGHTTIYHLTSPLEVKIIGKTIDDAVGEAYDKAATMLGLGFPGGPRIDQRAQLGNPQKYQLPVSRLGKESLDLSFSGLKTALLYQIRGIPTGKGKARRFERNYNDLSEQNINDLAASFQQAAVTALLLKLKRAHAALSNPPQNTGEIRGKMGGGGGGVRSLVVGGGVSANSKLRHELIGFAETHHLELRLPKMPFCVDNAAMIAGYGGLKFQQGLVDDLSLSPQPTGSLT